MEKHNVSRRSSTHEIGQTDARGHDDVVAALLREIMTAWGTDMCVTSADALDEVRSGMIVFEQSLWHACPGTSAASIPRCGEYGRALPIDVCPFGAVRGLVAIGTGIPT